ncbi:MAG: hypothetical protein J6A05_04785, partial [Oscillospiraceae bacterium]|nr:hypothetical protein [Oscillospiraceae bacterium]
GIIPGGVMLQGKSYRDLSPDKLLSLYDVNAAALWQETLEKTGLTSVDNLKITVSDSFSGNELIYNISEQWREKLLLMSSVEIVSETEYESKLAEKNFSIALIELDAENNSVTDFFKYFTESEYSSVYDSTTLKSDIKTASMATNLSDAVENYSNIEKIILDGYLFVPLFYKNEFFISDISASDIVYHPFVSSADFSEAKYYD